MPDMHIGTWHARAQNAALDAVHGRASAANRVLVQGLHFVSLAKDAGLNPDFLSDFVKGLNAALSDLQGENERTLDAERLAVDFYALDLSELRALVKEME